MTVQSLYDEGVIKFLYKKRLISIDILCYFDYVKYYNQRRDEGVNYTNAVLDTSIKFGISTSTVKRAIKTIKK